MNARTIRIMIITVVVALAVAATALAGEKAPQKVVEFAKSDLAALGSDPVLVAAVKAENAKGKTLDKIKEMDKRWMGTAGTDDFMKSLMTNAAAKRLLQLQDSAPYYAEFILVDNQGANVAMSDKTSDYWQGDEAKFTKSFTGGAGTIYVADVEFDKSSQAYTTQVSVPVLEEGVAIGVLVIGIDVDKLK